jgi:hypothetical protein
MNQDKEMRDEYLQMLEDIKHLAMATGEHRGARIALEEIKKRLSHAGLDLPTIYSLDIEELLRKHKEDA